MRLPALAILLYALTAFANPIVNDVTQLNPIEVDRVEAPTTVEAIQKLVRESAIPVSVGGGHFSMGGQTASEHTLHLDMRHFDKVVAFDAAKKIITVQTGITWRKIQETVDPAGLSVKIMQSYANFTVGGSLSVNVHGRYIGEGPLVLSVRAIKIVLADGSLVEATPTTRPDIFYGAIGGYGGLGVLVEATLDLAPNDKIERHAKQLRIGEYREFFEHEIRRDTGAIFHNGDIYPPDYQRVIAITWEKTDKPATIPDHLMPEHTATWMERAELTAMSRMRLVKELRARVLDPMKVKDQPVVWRNYEASYDVQSLEPASRKKSTYVLQEYFIPVDKFDQFTPKMTEIFKRSKANVLNVSIRHAIKDPGTLLAWAKEESFAFVVYYEQGTSPAARETVAKWTRELIDAATALGGSYYLPYQIVASDEQFRRAYPRADEYFALKKKLDPSYKFRNKLWDRYYHQRSASLSRPEENSFLTLPEWYVVYSADEYADFLAGGGRPSRFPFFGSVARFWKLYGTVTRRTWRDYPFNFRTHLMIAVVGASYSAEYLGRGIYEQTIGRMSEWIGGYGRGKPTAEDRYLQQVAYDYGRFIHDTPWYAFPFAKKLGEFWRLRSDREASWWRARERSLEGLGELAAKTAWAWVIGGGTRAVYEPEELTTRVLVQKPKAPLDPRLEIADDTDPLFTELKAPRYQKFTDVMTTALPTLAVEAIEGHRRIVLSVVGPREQPVAGELAEVLSQADLATTPPTKRTYVLADVSQLSPLAAQLASRNLRIEHFYDY